MRTPARITVTVAIAQRSKTLDAYQWTSTIMTALFDLFYKQSAFERLVFLF